MTSKLVSPDELDYLGAYADNGLEVIDFPDNVQVQSLDFAHIVEEKVGDLYYPDFVKPVIDD